MLLLHSNKWNCFFLVACFFLLQFLFINPTGEFALNDDWVMAHTVKDWAETGEFQLLPYAGPTFHIQALYATLVVKIFGFSFSLLRLSTLIITGTVIFLLYLFLERQTKKPLLAAMISVSFLYFPIFYNLSFTFMTDIPALLFLLLSIISYEKGFKEKSSGWMFIGSVIAALAFFIRQTNILLLFAAAIVAFGKGRKKNKEEFAFVFGLPMLLFVLIYWLLHQYGLMPQALGSHIVEGNWGDWGTNLLSWVWQFSIIIGLAGLPFTCAWLYSHKKACMKDRWFLFSLLLFGLVSVFFNNIWIDRFWHVGNIISAHGLGPLQVMSGKVLTVISPSIQVWLTVIGAASVVVLAWMLKGVKVGHLHKVLIFFWVGYLAVVSSVTSFDRYALPLIMITLFFVAKALSKTEYNKTIAIIGIACFGIMSIVGTKHYLTWNQIRWEFGQKLLDQGVVATDIDAGYEWNGWYTYWEEVHAENPPERTIDDPWWIRSMFPNNTREYVISFSPLAGYEIVKSKTISTYNPNNVVFILRRE